MVYVGVEMIIFQITNNDHKKVIHMLFRTRPLAEMALLIENNIHYYQECPIIE